MARIYYRITLEGGAGGVMGHGYQEIEEQNGEHRVARFVSLEGDELFEALPPGVGSRVVDTAPTVSAEFLAKREAALAPPPSPAPDYGKIGDGREPEADAIAAASVIVTADGSSSGASQA